MCTIQFLTGSGASPMVSQPLLPYCPSLTIIYNLSIIKLRYAQYSSISARLSIQSHMLFYSKKKNYPPLFLNNTILHMVQFKYLRSPSPDPLMQLGLHTSTLFAWNLGGSLAHSTVSSIAMRTHHHFWNSIWLQCGPIWNMLALSGIPTLRRTLKLLNMCKSLD